MPASDLSDAEVADVLEREGVVRVAFRDGESVYLIPLGYVWLYSGLHGVTELGRKTRLAEVDPRVAFQVDTSSDTGVFEWRSVTGEGRFELVRDESVKREVLMALQPIISAAPEWWQRDQRPKIASGTLQVWRITPNHLHGRRYGPKAGTTYGTTDGT